MTNITSYPEHGELLKDKIILITGAGGGIGKAISLACAKQGATVVLTGKIEEKLNHTYDEITQQTDTQPLIYPLDLSTLDDAGADSLAGGIDKEFGRLDGLVHNAALLATVTPYAQFETELWQKIFQINVHAPFILTKACMPLLQASDAASILFTGSGVGQQGIAYWGAYAASKFANEGMMQTLGDELEFQNIKVNMVDPGVVRTPMRALAFPAEDPNTLPAPEKIVDVYLYLLGSDSKGITKQRLDAWVK